MDTNLHLTILAIDIFIRIAAFAAIFAAVHRSFASAHTKLPGILNRPSRTTPRAIYANLDSVKREPCAGQ